MQDHSPRRQSARDLQRQSEAQTGSGVTHGSYLRYRSAARQAHRDRPHVHLRDRVSRRRRSCSRRPASTPTCGSKTSRREDETEAARSDRVDEGRGRPAPRDRRATSSASPTSAATAACVTAAVCPVRGQRTKTNARTRKGPKRTVAGKKKAARRSRPLARDIDLTTAPLLDGAVVDVASGGDVPQADPERFEQRDLVVVLAARGLARRRSLPATARPSSRRRRRARPPAGHPIRPALARSSRPR